MSGMGGIFATSNFKRPYFSGGDDFTKSQIAVPPNIIQPILMSAANGLHYWAELLAAKLFALLAVR